MKNLFDFDYDRSILSVSNSLLRYYGLPTLHPSLPFLDEKLSRRRQNVVLLILDGMGMDLIAKNLPSSSFIRQHVAMPIFSVFPPTTTAATTAYHSGKSPWESGWLGWTSYYKQYDEIIETFRNTAFYSGKALSTPPPATDVLKYETIYEKIVAHCPEVEFHKVFPPFEKNGVGSFAEMCDKILSLSRRNNREKLFCAYWTEPDHSVHRQGTTAPLIKEILNDIDANLQRLCDGMQDTLLIVSADHGELDIEEIYLNDYPGLCGCLLRPPALEARFTTFWVKEGCHENFVAEFNKVLASDFRLYTRREFMESGLLGSGERHPLVSEFLGDFVAVALTDKSLRYSTGEKVFPVLKAEHAGISEQEMLIPLILVEKEK